MQSDITTRYVLVMGVGNTLMQDDGVGAAVIQALSENPDTHPALRLIDGGTIGLALLPEIEDADAVVIVDAAVLQCEPGSMQVFMGQEIEQRLAEKRNSVHEVALLDLLAAAAMRGKLPANRALVGIQPGCTDWGDRCTPPVAAAVQDACAAINRIASAWLNDEAAA